MPRRARRALLPDAPTTIHFIWRCHNRDFLLDSDEVKERYLKLLAHHKKRYGIEIYGYVVMNNHFHAVLRLPSRTKWQNFSRTVNSRLAVGINRARRRCGHVILDRPRTIVLERGNDVLATLRYIELNPVRAGIVHRARDYKWSSNRCHALGHVDRVVDECPAVNALGASAARRRAAFVAMFGTVECAHDLQRRPELVDVNFVGSAKWVQGRIFSLRRATACRAPPCDPSARRGRASRSSKGLAAQRG